MSFQLVGAAVAAIAVALFIYVEVSKRTTFATLEAYAREGNVDAYLAVLDRPITRVLYPRYNRLFMRLNAMLGLGTMDEAVAIIEEMETLPMNDEQRLALAVKAFNVYVELEDADRAAGELACIEAQGDEPVAQASRRTFEIFLKGSSAYIDEMEAQLGEAQAGEEALLCHLLAVQYENRGDTDRAEAYTRRAAKLLGV